MCTKASVALETFRTCIPSCSNQPHYWFRVYELSLKVDGVKYEKVEWKDHEKTNLIFAACKFWYLWCRRPSISYNTVAMMWLVARGPMNALALYERLRY